MSVPVRDKDELELMRQSGVMTAKALKKTVQAAKPGVNLLELEKIAEKEILSLGGGSSFKTVPGYFWTTCLTVNDEVVHGIPRDYMLLDGDKISIDLGAVYKGWHTDAAWSIIVRKQGAGSRVQDEKDIFMRVGERALENAIAQAVDGNQIGDISSAIQTTIEDAGYNVVRALVGHGVGRQPHEAPEIPGVGKSGTGMKLRAGQTIAIEAIYTAGDYEVEELEDGWTIATVDGSLGGLFEMTVVVGKDKAEVLTDWRKV